MFIIVLRIRVVSETLTKNIQLFSRFPSYIFLLRDLKNDRKEKYEFEKIEIVEFVSTNFRHKKLYLIKFVKQKMRRYYKLNKCFIRG